MLAIYVAGIVSGVLLIVIGLAGWVRNAGKKLGGEDNPAPQGVPGAYGAPHASAAPVASDGKNHVRGRNRHIARAA